MIAVDYMDAKQGSTNLRILWQTEREREFERERKKEGKKKRFSIRFVRFRVDISRDKW